MVITTNYSRSDWNRAIPNIVITLIPIIFLFSATLFLYIPYLQNWTFFLDYQTEDEMLVRFINYLEDNQQYQIGFFTPDGWVPFFIFLWMGGALFPLWIIWRFHKIIPIVWIIKKLGIENRMKLVIFKNGKPIRKIRDLLK